MVELWKSQCGWRYRFNLGAFVYNKMAGKKIALRKQKSCCLHGCTAGYAPTVLSCSLSPRKFHSFCCSHPFSLNTQQIFKTLLSLLGNISNIHMKIQNNLINCNVLPPSFLKSQHYIVFTLVNPILEPNTG